MSGNGKFKFLARNKLRFYIGTGFLSTLMSILSFLTFAKVWQPTFDYYHIPMVIIYVLLPFGYMVGCWYIGYWYEMSKFQEYEMEHQNKVWNKEFKEICEDVKAIKKKLEIE